MPPDKDVHQQLYSQLSGLDKTLKKLELDTAEIANDTKILKTWMKSFDAVPEPPTIVTDAEHVNKDASHSPSNLSANESFASIEEFIPEVENGTDSLNLQFTTTQS